MKKLVSLFLVFSIFCQFSFADRGSFGLLDSRSQGTSLSEYFYKNSPNDLLVPVRLIGEVDKPGLYHLPSDTNILTLLSISGGPTKTADTEKVQVQRGSNKKTENFNLEELLASGKDISVKEGDVVYVPVRGSAVDQNTVKTVTVIAGLLGIILSGILITQALEN